MKTKQLPDLMAEMESWNLPSKKIQTPKISIEAPVANVKKSCSNCLYSPPHNNGIVCAFYNRTCTVGTGLRNWQHYT